MHTKDLGKIHTMVLMTVASGQVDPGVLFMFLFLLVCVFIFYNNYTLILY